MDGRPHPPEYALHTAMGFSTGKWEGDILTVTTDHLKEGWFRRNGLARSDRAVVTEHFIRHDDQLTWVTMVNDPAYLEDVVKAYNEFFFHYDESPLLVINTSDIDFVENEEDLENLIAVIRRMRKGTHHYIPIAGRRK